MKKRSKELAEQKRKKELTVMREMIGIYCRGKHKSKKMLCSECEELWSYAAFRTEHCPFMETKTFCSNCSVHCYKPEMREKVRAVMRYSGPRILFHHPYMALWHVISSRIEKKKQKKKES